MIESYKSVSYGSLWTFFLLLKFPRNKTPFKNDFNNTHAQSWIEFLDSRSSNKNKVKPPTLEFILVIINYIAYVQFQGHEV